MNGKTSRHHHYLSQFYLKGFTNGRSKKSKLTTIDSRTRKKIETIPRNVGGVRDFNRIEVEGVDPEILERNLATFEGEVATALKAIEAQCKFDGDNKALVLNLIALLAVRSPEMREHLRKFHAEIAERIMDLTLASKERWESQMKKMREDGYGLDSDITYEEMKNFHERKEYDITVAREWHIHLEFVGMEAVLPCLFGRNWLLVKRAQGTGPFITTDRPVVLVWKNPESIPPIFRNSPGYGMKDTIVFFPLSQDVVLVGEFGGNDSVIEAGEEYVAHINTVMMHTAYSQLYTPKLDFPFIGRDGSVQKGNLVIEYLRNSSHE
ncbi:MAG: hypothetical protein A2W28_09915 [Gammaproteobacteria bacterium RBG_16_51_14]|nr:MAG: hypothetical protein A2W28_09915 [Gammaproteobacteria bacterium RBG_16_51_14]